MAETNVVRLVPPAPKRNSPAAVVLAGLLIVCRSGVAVLAGYGLLRLTLG